MLGRREWTLEWRREVVRQGSMPRRAAWFSRRRSASTLGYRWTMLRLLLPWMWRRSGWKRLVSTLGVVGVVLVLVGGRAGAKLVGGVFGSRGNDAVRGLLAGRVEEMRSAGSGRR